MKILEYLFGSSVESFSREQLLKKDDDFLIFLLNRKAEDISWPTGNACISILIQRFYERLKKLEKK